MAGQEHPRFCAAAVFQSPFRQPVFPVISIIKQNPGQFYEIRIGICCRGIAFCLLQFHTMVRYVFAGSSICEKTCEEFLCLSCSRAFHCVKDIFISNIDDIRQFKNDPGEVRQRRRINVSFIMYEVQVPGNAVLRMAMATGPGQDPVRFFLLRKAEVREKILAFIVKERNVLFGYKPSFFFRSFENKRLRIYGLYAKVTMLFQKVCVFLPVPNQPRIKQAAIMPFKIITQADIFFLPFTDVFQKESGYTTIGADDPSCIDIGLHIRWLNAEEPGCGIDCQAF